MKQKSNSVSCWILLRSALVALIVGTSFTSHSQVISTFAGIGTSGAGYSGDGGPATAADIFKPIGVALDASGNLYIADQSNSRVRIVNTSGIISTFAGSATAGYGGDNGPATAAKLFSPYDVAVDAAGNVYIDEQGNYRIRKVNTSGIITTIAGAGLNAYSGDGGPATAADINAPQGVAVDASGNVYIADYSNDLVRKVNTSGIISTFAGLVSGGTAGHGGYSGDGGQATAADLDGPCHLTFDASGNLYIADQVNQRIRVVNTTSGVISTYAGTGTSGTSPTSGPATAVPLDNPRCIHFDAAGNLYIADESADRILKVTSSGTVSSYVGTGNAGYNNDNVLATAGELDFPQGVTVDPSGNLYIGDYDNDRIRKVTAPLSVSLSSTNITCNGSNNGIASATPAGGGTPYTYSWSPGGKTTSTITGLSVGTYTIHITDHVSETASATVTISQPTALTTNASVTANNTCNGGTNGSASTTPSGGTSPYTYSWSGGGGAGSTASGLSAATYTITVMDNHGCSATASAAITQPIALSTNASVAANVTCNSGSNGSASASPSNGTPPYTYSWSGGGGNSSVANALAAGTYTVTVQDNCSASATASVTITQPNVLTTGASAPNITCSGGTTTATANPSNGTPPYTYSWSGGGGNGSTANALSAGTYSLTVMDSCGGSATASVTITQPIPLSTSALVISNSCNGSSNGNASANPSGGTSPYTYSWSNGIVANPTGPALSAGTYSVTVMDNCGGTATASVTIKPSTLIVATIYTSANVSCNGGSNGQAKVSVSGGSFPYTYSWNPVTSSTYIASGLSAGAYTVTVVDNNGCSNTSSTTVTQPGALKDSLAIVTYPQCGGETATATVGVQGGTSPYNYSWNPDVSSTATATGLTTRSYVVQVKDNNGCYNNLSFSITQPPIPVMRDSIVSSATVNVLCNGGSNGSATVGVKYGTTPYTYSWSPAGGNNATASGLSAGTYLVTVNDGGGCTVTASVSIGQPGALSATTFTSGNVSCNGSSNGQAKVSASGGSLPYTYSWNPGGSSTYVVGSLTAGTYTVTVEDNCGASASSSAVITQPAALSDSVATISYPLCTGGTGSATIGATGGTMPYNYTWSPDVSSGASAAGLSVRAYVVQVKDINGCYKNVNFSITQPAALRDSIIKSATVDISCNGANSGSATVGVKYGTMPYTYSWSPAGGNSATASGLSGGTYTVTVSGGGGCTVTASVNITQPGTLTPTASIGTAITCNGSSNATAKVSVSGGSTPYTYSWSPVSSSTYIASGLSAGTYSVTVEDNCGASASTSIAVSQPAILSDSVITSSVVSPPCSGGGTGSATIGVTGGTSPYNYKWSPNVSTTATATGLTVRSYVIQVKDAKGCYNNITFNVTCSTPETVTYKGTGATCCPLSDNINLYPNPNTGQFTLSGLQQGMILEMYDYTGKLISRTTTTNESMQLNITQANGVYLIRILDKDGNLVSEKKVVKTQ